MVFIQQAEEQLVPFPDWQRRHVFLRDPFQCPFVAVGHDTLPLVGGKQKHVFPVGAAYKGDDTAQLIRCQGQTGFLQHFPCEAFLGGFAAFKMSADPQPFIVVDVIAFFRAVQHQITIVFLKITKGRHIGNAHGIPPAGMVWPYYTA